MATKIVTKNSSTAGAAPTATDLVQGELAVNVADGRLYTEDNAAAIVELGVNPATEITANAGIALPDNQKATFGAGDDLQIYHDPSAGSIIQEAGAGSLFVRASTNIQLEGVNGENMAIFNENGSVQLYYNNAEKLATTSAGIDVTGTATMDGLTVDGDGSFKTGSGAVLTVGTTNASAAAGQVVGQITFDNADISGNKANAEIRGMAHDAFGRTNIDFRTGDSGSLKTRALVSWNGDISFYEDTGTTPKFFWDASAESLGIGTSSPQNLLHINKSDSLASAMQFTNSTTGATSSDGVFVGLGSGEQGYFWNYEANDLILGTNNTERMRIDSSGNVKQNSVNTSTNVGYSVNNGTYDAIALGTGGFGVNGGAATDGGIRAYNNLLFGTGASATERMRILSDGAAAFGCTTSRPAEFTHPDGFAIRYDVRGQFQNTVTNAACGIINRDGTDGDLLSFRKNGTAVGSIGTLVSSLTIGSGDTGLILQPAYDRILPFNVSTNAGRDNAIDLGASGSRFKDLYLSQDSYQRSVQLADSAAARANGYITELRTYYTDESLRLSLNTHKVISTTGYNVPSNILFHTYTGGSSSEKMRINSSGDVSIGTTQNAGYKLKLEGAGTVQLINRTGSDGALMLFQNDGLNCGEIRCSGTSTSYVTSSDYRLKENIADADDAGSKIDSIQVRKYDWKADGSHQDYGMIAQELQAVAPEAVSGDADSEEMMGVDYSKLVPMLIKEIQSLRNRVAQLETGE